MKKTIIHIILCLCIFNPLFGQFIDFSAPVDVKSSGEPLSTVLAEIESKYHVTFSYSRDLIPLDQKIYADIKEMPCKEALDQLFEQTQVVYGVVGNQIVLGIDTQKIAILPDQGNANEFGQNGEAWASNSMIMEGNQFRQQYDLPVLPRAKQMKALQVPNRRYLIELEPGSTESDNALSIFDRIERIENTPVLHASVFSPLGIRTTSDLTEPTNIGLHLLWGLDPALDGVSLSGLGNTVHGDMNGIQLSGVFNTVGEQVKGAQFAGITNINLENTEGASFAGVANYSKEVTGAQLAGVINVATGNTTGFQGAGVINVSTKGNHVSQIGGVANFAAAESDLQIAGVLNIGRNVSTGQIGGVLNIAKKVDGFQIGLLNFADTVNGPAIGLLSFIKNGYHSIELSGQDGLHANTMIRLGTKPFYNILRIGARLDEKTWAFGYGIGTSIRMGRRNALQFELMSSHVNENELWTNQLNLLNQLNVIANIKIGRHLGLVIGPVINVAVSQVYNADTDTYGMNIGSNYIFNETSYRSWRKPLNVKGWIGFHAGIRFDSR
jgi:hypothetical protein